MTNRRGRTLVWMAIVAGYSTGLILSNLLHYTFMSAAANNNNDDNSSSSGDNFRGSSSTNGVSMEELMFLLEHRKNCSTTTTAINNINQTDDSAYHHDDNQSSDLRDKTDEHVKQSSSSWLMPPPAQPQSRTAPVSRIFLLGERNSGTNYVSKLLQEAFHPFYSKGDPSAFNFVNGIPIFEHKHMFRHNLLNPGELAALKHILVKSGALFILAVRSPCEWADGMYRKPWHMCPPSYYDETHRKVKESAALRAFKRQGVKMPPGFYCPRGSEIQINTKALVERNISRTEFFDSFHWEDGKESKKARTRDDYTYEHIFALRRHKLALMEQVLHLAMPLHRVKLVHLDKVEVAPDLFLSNLATEFDLQHNPINMTKTRSAKVHKEPLCLSDEEWALALDRIDWEMEGRFGFHPMHCHVCEGTQIDDKQIHANINSNESVN